MSADVKLLRALGSPAADLRALPRQVTPYFFTQRMGDVPKELSFDLASALAKARLLDAESYLAEDPR